ncbi:hypothetical protein AB1Y20_011926 [Prymnesium parvum]|uniref:Uncharacterized protein n=1 Tax=Prymnesium parvum TaxID=97485 RepID=A0AB34IQN7_PRYPA
MNPPTRQVDGIKAEHASAPPLDVPEPEAASGEVVQARSRLGTTSQGVAHDEFAHDLEQKHGESSRNAAEAAAVSSSPPPDVPEGGAASHEVMQARSHPGTTRQQVAHEELARVIDQEGVVRRVLGPPPRAEAKADSS